MTKAKVSLKIQGLNQLMTSPAVTAFLVKRAQAIAAKAGDDFEVNVVPHKWTARAFIRAANAEGARREAADKVLTRAING